MLAFNASALPHFFDPPTSPPRRNHIFLTSNRYINTSTLSGILMSASKPLTTARLNYFLSELLIAAFHLPNHSITASDSSAHGVGVTSASWCVLLFLFMLFLFMFGLTSVSSTFISTVSFPNSSYLSPREHTDWLADPISRRAAGPSAQRWSETPGQGWNEDGEYELRSGISRSAINAYWIFMHTLAHLGCVFGLTGRLVLPSGLTFLPPPTMH